ncbi:MAG TPA: efflux RND transporter periplasmic adaptor subunit [Xanthomonadaceae bacterium]|nr:efflux RND transporter periplasmic adaptor subunit [Xanthomonadaceae bacterium]
MRIERRWAGLLLLPALAFADAPVLLTGTVEDAEAQRVVAPRVDSWRVQVQWMAPEGEPVAAGELVVRFDPADLLNRVEQKEAEERQVMQRHRQSVDEAGLRLLEAEVAVAEAEATLRKAELDAGIPAAFLPKLNWERFQLDAEKARGVLAQAREKLSAEQTALATARAEASLDERRLAAEMAYLQSQLAAMTAHADRDGTVQYGTTRMRGNISKIFPGDNAQPGEVVAIVSGRDSLVVRAWVHEADLYRVPVGARVSVVLDAMPAREISGRVQQISRQGVSKPLWGRSVYFDALVLLDDGHDTLMPGMSARVEIVDSGSPLAGGTP